MSTPIPDSPDAPSQALQRAAQHRDWLVAHERWLPDGTANFEAREYLCRLGRIFSVSHQGGRLYAACQFLDGDELQPHPVMQPLILALPHDQSGWTQAFWLFQPSGRLGGSRPADILLSQPYDVLVAALKDFQGDSGI